MTIALRAGLTPSLVVAVLGLALVLPATGVAAQPRASLADIEDEVMCVECGTALNLSNAPVADREREFIRREIDRGKSKEEIKEALVQRLGPAVLAVPSNEGFGIVAYVVPALALVAALAGLVLLARRWRAPSRRTAPAPALDPEDARRLERDMAAYDP